MLRKENQSMLNSRVIPSFNRMPMNGWYNTDCDLSFFTQGLIPCFLLFCEDFQMGVPDAKLDISANSERKRNICMSKSKSRSWQLETNQILNFDDVAIV